MTVLFVFFITARQLHNGLFLPNTLPLAQLETDPYGQQMCQINRVTALYSFMSFLDSIFVGDSSFIAL